MSATPLRVLHVADGSPCDHDPPCPVVALRRAVPARELAVIARDAILDAARSGDRAELQRLADVMAYAHGAADGAWVALRDGVATQEPDRFLERLERAAL